jgi:hypothetical protein
LIFIPQIAFLFMFISRRKWLYEQWFSWWIKSCENLVYRAKCGAYFWNCLCYSCYNGHKKHRKLERTTDNFSNSFHDLFRSTACLRNYNCTCYSDERLFGFLNMQGMTLMLLYLLGLNGNFSAYIWIKF